MSQRVGGRGGSVEDWLRSHLELLLVQILVVVVNNQMRLLMAEVDKGSRRTVFALG